MKKKKPQTSGKSKAVEEKTPEQMRMDEKE